MSKENDYFEEILVILYEEDLIGLVPCGCPKDEYACEAARISEALSSCKTLEEIKTCVDRVFKKYFESVYQTNDEQLNKVSERIWKLRE